MADIIINPVESTFEEVQERAAIEAGGIAPSAEYIKPTDEEIAEAIESQERWHRNNVSTERSHG